MSEKTEESSSTQLYPTPKKGPLADDHSDYAAPIIFTGPKDKDIWLPMVVIAIVLFIIIGLVILKVAMGKTPH